MGELNFLLHSYSASEIIAILVVCLLLVVTVVKAAEFVWIKVRGYFDIKNDEDRWHSEISNGISDIKEDLGYTKNRLDDLEEKAEERGRRLERVEEYTKKDHEREKKILEHQSKMDEMCSRVQQRLQDDTRWSFKDAYNYYYIKEKKIDQESLEALEKKYEHYKAAGGNSFVDNIMTKIRTLPIVERM